MKSKGLRSIEEFVYPSMGDWSGIGWELFNRMKVSSGRYFRLCGGREIESPSTDREDAFVIARLNITPYNSIWDAL